MDAYTVCNAYQTGNIGMFIHHVSQMWYVPDMLHTAVHHKHKQCVSGTRCVWVCRGVTPAARVVGGLNLCVIGMLIHKGEVLVGVGYGKGVSPFPKGENFENLMS